MNIIIFFFFFSSRRRHTRCGRDWSSDVCSSDLLDLGAGVHHERTIARDGLVEGPRGGEQEASTSAAGRGLDDFAVAKENQRRGRDGLPLRTEEHLSVVH